MALKKRSTVRRKKVSSASKKPRKSVRARMRRPRQKQSVAARTTTPRSPRYARVTQHVRVTAGRSHKRPTLGFFDPAQAIHAGNTAHFDVYYLSRLGQKGADLAQAIVQTCEGDYAALQAIFGGLTPGRLPFVVQITSDSSGASHSSCLGTDVVVGGNSGTSVDFIRSLLVAEVDEVFMANFGFGWDCGASPGEGLSRVLANDLYKGVEPADFVSSNVWLNLNPRPNFVDQADPTDTNYKSIGCSVLFLNWLRFELNHGWAEIVASGGATLADTYRGLTGKNTGWSDFSAVIDTSFPVGKTYRLKTDNPFLLQTS
jgi:hypothetical protein